MIVRINQFDAGGAEQSGGWDAGDLRGPINCVLPPGTIALELLILDSDESGQKLDAGFRQAQLRQLAPDVLAALRDSREQIVVRLDGPLIAGELLAAFKHLTDPHGLGRFAISPVQKFDTLAMPAVGSVRICLPAPQVQAIFDDAELGLHKSVRIRAFAVREQVVNPLLDIDELDDERWKDVLNEAGFVISASRGLQSLQILTHTLSAEQARARIVQKLSSAAGANA